MTMPVESDMGDKEAGSGWYTGVDLEWRPSPQPSSTSPAPPLPPLPPTYTSDYGQHGNSGISGNGANGSRKRRWVEAASPRQDATSDVSWDRDLESLPTLNMTTPFGASSSRNVGTSATLDNSEDGVEEIPRTKMQTGCIPCL